MNMHSLRPVILTTASCLLSASLALASATVNYQGFLYRTDGSPAIGDRAIAATFAPAFDPTNIACVYGDDVCNIDVDYFQQGVADGNILPIGNVVTVNATGFFTGSGITDAPAGTKIYLFGLSTFSLEGALATSSHSSFLVPDMGAATNVDAALANQFIFGYPVGNGIHYGILPFPEPSSATLVLFAFAPILGLRRR